MDLQVTRRGHRAQTYQVDDFRLKEIAAIGIGHISMQRDDMYTLTFDMLKEGVTYQIQASTNIYTGWTNLMPLTATNASMPLLVPFADLPDYPVILLRIRVDDPSL